MAIPIRENPHTIVVLPLDLQGNSVTLEFTCRVTPEVIDRMATLLVSLVQSSPAIEEPADQSSAEATETPPPSAPPRRKPGPKPGSKRKGGRSKKTADEPTTVPESADSRAPGLQDAIKALEHYRTRDVQHLTVDDMLANQQDGRRMEASTERALRNFAESMRIKFRLLIPLGIEYSLLHPGRMQLYRSTKTTEPVTQLTDTEGRAILRLYNACDKFPVSR